MLKHYHIITTNMALKNKNFHGGATPKTGIKKNALSLSNTNGSFKFIPGLIID